MQSIKWWLDTTWGKFLVWDIVCATCKACTLFNITASAPLYRYTGMDQDEVEKATCRDNFLTPEEAKLYGLIDHVIGGEGDTYLPYSVVQKFRNAGLVDDLSKGLLGL